MERVLVTGATGLIGRHLLAPLAERGLEVHAVGSRRPAATPEGVHAWWTADLTDDGSARDLIARARPDLLVHLAWLTVRAQRFSWDDNARWARGSAALLEAFCRAGGRRMVAAGTCAEYDWSVGGVLSERSPLRPGSPYGNAKMRLYREAVDIAAGTGVDLAWGRLFYVYGPGEHPSRLVASVTCALLAGEEIATTSGTQHRDFLFAPDVARAFAALLMSSAVDAVNIGSGHGVRVRALVQLLAGHIGRPDLLRIGALPDREGEPERLIADVDRLHTLVPWRPMVTLEEGTRLTVEDWRRRLSQ